MSITRLTDTNTYNMTFVILSTRVLYVTGICRVSVNQVISFPVKCFQILLSSLIIQICTCVLNFHTFMLVRQAFLKFMLLLQLTMLMDELRITSTAERSFSWSLRVTHSRKAQAISLRYVTHILKHFHSDSWCAHVCQSALAWCLWFWAFSEFFSSVWNAVVTARLLLFRISSKWCSISASVAETELQTL